MSPTAPGDGSASSESDRPVGFHREKWAFTRTEPQATPPPDPATPANLRPDPPREDRRRLLTPVSPGTATFGPGQARQTALILLAATLVRLAWLLAPPVYSDDVYRYVWEGRVWAAGHNPFALAPNDPALTGLRDAAIWPHVNHPELSSIYPPFAQLLFVLLAPGGLLAWKLIATLADVGTCFLLARRSARSALLWALLPLTAVESAGSGHLESIAIFCTLAALSTTAIARPPATAPPSPAQNLSKPTTSLLIPPRAAAIALAWVAAMLKLLPAVTLLPLLRTPRAWALAIVATILAFLPILAAGPHLLAGFNAYRDHWSFNGSAYPLLGALAADAGLTGDPARTLLQVLGATILAGQAWRLRHAPPAEAAVSLTMTATAAFVLLSPTVHPWYVLWPLSVALWIGGPSSATWTLAAVLVPVAYRVLGTLHDGVWHEDPLTRWVIWGPVWAMVGRGAWHSRARQRLFLGSSS